MTPSHTCHTSHRLFRGIFYCLLLLAVICPPSWWVASTAEAAISSCSASVTPTSISTNATDTLQFTVTNSDSVDIRWVHLTAPSEDFEITTGNTAGWASTIDSPTEIVFKFGTLAPGASQTFSVTVQAGVSPVAAAPWGVEASDTTGGASPASCSGSTSVAISAPASPPVLSSITASSVSTSGATITWTTDKSATSVVLYGTTTSYGTTSSSSTLVTSHSRSLTGLFASTTYHYQVSSTDSNGNMTTSADNTFTTATPEAAPSSTPTPTPTVVKVTTSGAAASLTPTPTPTPTPLPLRAVTSVAAPTVSPEPTPAPVIVDTTNPTVELQEVPTAPVATPGAITGIARDDREVVRVQYSTDEGHNWLPVDLVEDPGTTETLFSFTPRVTADGNYKVVVRAFDRSGNIGQSSTVELIIDQLPPEVGTALISLGPQLLQADEDGVLAGLMGVDYTVTVAARGGATSIDLRLGESVHSLGQHIGTNLWSGTLHTTEPGPHTIVAHTLDGAGNVTDRIIGTFHALAGGQVVDTAGAAIAEARVELFYFEPTVNDFVPWQGSAFAQRNPQVTAADGHFTFSPPAGTYYLAVTAPGWSDARTTIFTLPVPRPLGMSMPLVRPRQLSIGSWALPLPAEQMTTVPVYVAPARSASVHPLLNQSLPAFTATTTAGEEVPSSTVTHGTTHVLSVMTGWSPHASEQMAALEELAQAHPQTVTALVSESPSLGVRLWQERGHYQVPILLDPDGKLQTQLSVTATPLHFILDSTGVVRSVVSGLQNTAALQKLLGL